MPFFDILLRRRSFHIAKNEQQINNAIRDAKVRLIGSDGEQLGIFSGADALEKAYDEGLDLVKISPNADPPVCKIMDYGKHRFEQSKREKEMKRNQHIVETHEIRLSPNIDAHDVEFKMKAARKFLEKGDKLKITIRFRGRQMAHTELGRDQLLKFTEALSDLGVVDKQPKLDGRHMTMFMSAKLAPKPETKKKTKPLENVETKETTKE
ncbi:MAG: translation initiation factor IF-3 [Oscillospiraceae bacterium]|nr:translation initiation factor IF-3 [Oscillospiraceae bacterium]